MYPNFEHPIKYLTGGGADLRYLCKVTLNLKKKHLAFPSPFMEDAWLQMYGDNKKGFTFSNMMSLHTLQSYCRKLFPIEF